MHSSIGIARRGNRAIVPKAFGGATVIVEPWPRDGVDRAFDQLINADLIARLADTAGLRIKADGIKPVAE